MTLTPTSPAFSHGGDIPPQFTASACRHGVLGFSHHRSAACVFMARSQ